MNPHRLAFILLVLLFPAGLIGQFPNIGIERLSIKEGLDVHSVLALIQDQKGFIWLGASNGLYKYDGYSFTYYKQPLNCQNCNTAELGEVVDLLQDDKGIIWILSNAGITLFDPEREKSVLLVDFSAIDSTWSKGFRGLLKMTRDSKNNVWATGPEGLVKITSKRKPGGPIIYDSLINEHDGDYNIEFLQLPSEKGPGGNSISAIYEDLSGNLWIGSQDGLYVKRFEENHFFRFIPWDEKAKTLENPAVFDLLEISKQSILIATLGGLFELTNTAAALKNMDSGGSQTGIRLLDTGSKELILSLYKTDRGDILVGTVYDLLKLKKKGEAGEYSFESVYRGLTDPDEFGFSNNTNDILEDRSGILWVAHTYYGIRKINLNNRPFLTYKDIVSDQFSHTDINSVYADSVGNIWIGTFGGGLYWIEQDTHEVQNYNPGVPVSHILCMDEIEPGKFWLGLYFGILEFDVQSKEFSDPLPAGETSNNLRSALVWDIKRDGDQVYIGTRKGLFVLDIPEQRLYQFTPDDKYASSLNWLNHFPTIIRSQDGGIWAINKSMGLCKISFNSEEGVIHVNPFSSSESGGRNIISWGKDNLLFEDPDGFIWTSDSTGFHRITLLSGLVESYPLPAHLKNELQLSPLSILADDHSNLWVGTQFGLYRLNTKTGEQRIFDRDDGLPILIHGHSSAFKRDDGTMLFGGIGGFYSFHPDSIKINEVIPEVVITEFRLFNKPVHPDTRDEAILTKNVSYTSSIELSHKQRDISIEFAALDYTDPVKNRYAYLLEKYDDEWIETDAGNRIATYTNLDPGTYVFRVKGSNNNGIWNEQGTSLTIVIHSPWWRTMLAYFIYGIAGVLIFFVVVYWRTRRLQKDKKILEKEVKSRTVELQEVNRLLVVQKEEIQSQKDALEKSNQTIFELDQVKTRFFNNISHEFRTLITLIKGPVEEVLEDNLTSRRSRRSLDIVRRNVHRLMKLVNQLLDISKLDKGNMSLILNEANVFDFAHAIAVSFSSLAESKGIQYRFHLPTTRSLVWFDADKLEKIISNLLSNALKFTEEGGQVVMKMNQKVKPDGKENILEISVSDTGYGIPIEDQQKIFDRFYQAEAHLKKEGGGTGIGLALTHDLVKLMHGTISVQSESGKGTTFTLHIPLGKDHLKEGEYSISVIRKVAGTKTPGSTELPEIKSDDLPEDDRQEVEDVDIPMILVVEDNAEIRMMIAENLEREFIVMEASDGSAGLKLAIDHMPELVITDLMMPRMDGIEMCTQLKSDLRTSHIPVIMLTAKAALEDKLEGLETGADDYIPKPFEIKEVIARTKNLIEQRKKLREKFSKTITIDPSDIVITPVDEKFLQKAIDVVEAHMSDDQFNLSGLCNEMNMSQSTIFRKLEALTNLSPIGFIRSIRLKRAASLLQQQFGNVSEIALEVGFNNPSYFSRMFSKYYEVSPSAYAKSYLSKEKPNS